MQSVKVKSNWISRMVGCAAITLLVTAGAIAESPTQMPVFALPDLDGKVRKSSEFMGHPVIIDFWATWCVSCKESIPTLAELSTKYEGKGLTVIGISLDKGSDEKIRKAAKKMGINYLVLVDKENTMSKVFGYSGIPSVYVFNRRGVTIKAMPGFDPDQDDQLVAATVKAL